MNRKSEPENELIQEPALLRVLTSEASQRGDTLASLASSLGVTYERLAQWRRGEGSIARARRGVHERAARYLGVPTVLVLAMAGLIGVEEFVWPTRVSLRERIIRDLERMRDNPFIGAFVPPDLEQASDSVKLFVLFLFHELDGESEYGRSRYRWLSDLHGAAAGERPRTPSERLF